MSQLRAGLSLAEDLQRVRQGQCLDYSVEITRKSAYHCRLNVLST